MLLMLPLIFLVISNTIHSMNRLIVMPNAAQIESNYRERFHDYYIDTAKLHITLGSQQVLENELLQLLEEHLIAYHESIQRPYIKQLLKGGVFELVKSFFAHDPGMYKKIEVRECEHYSEQYKENDKAKETLNH